MPPGGISQSGAYACTRVANIATTTTIATTANSAYRMIDYLRCQPNDAFMSDNIYDYPPTLP